MLHYASDVKHDPAQLFDLALRRQFVDNSSDLSLLVANTMKLPFISCDLGPLKHYNVLRKGKSSSPRSKRTKEVKHQAELKKTLGVLDKLKQELREPSYHEDLGNFVGIGKRLYNETPQDDLILERIRYPTFSELQSETPSMSDIQKDPS